MRAQRRAQARLAGAFVERIAPPARRQPPERRVEPACNRATDRDARARRSTPARSSGLEIFDRSAAIRFTARVGNQQNLDVRPPGPLQQQAMTQRRARAARLIEHDQLAARDRRRRARGPRSRLRGPVASMISTCESARRLASDVHVRARREAVLSIPRARPPPRRERRAAARFAREASSARPPGVRHAARNRRARACGRWPRRKCGIIDLDERGTTEPDLHLVGQLERASRATARGPDSAGRD